MQNGHTHNFDTNEQQIHLNQNIDSLYFGLYWILWPVLMKMKLPSLKKQAAKPQLRLTPQIRCLETTISELTILMAVFKMTTLVTGKSPKALISKSLNAHEQWSCAPSVPKTLNSGAHGTASCAPR